MFSNQENGKQDGGGNGGGGWLSSGLWSVGESKGQFLFKNENPYEDSKLPGMEHHAVVLALRASFGSW